MQPLVPLALSHKFYVLDSHVVSVLEHLDGHVPHEQLAVFAAGQQLLGVRRHTALDVLLLHLAADKPREHHPPGLLLRSVFAAQCVWRGSSLLALEKLYGVVSTVHDKTLITEHCSGFVDAFVMIVVVVHQVVDAVSL